MLTMSKKISYPFAVGARSALDLSGTTVIYDGIFPPPRWRTVDPEGAIAGDLGRVMARFGSSAKCSSEALIAGEDVDHLPAGCTDGTVPRRLPLRHVTATHATTRR